MYADCRPCEFSGHDDAYLRFRQERKPAGIVPRNELFWRIMVLYRHKFVNKEMNARTLIVKSVHKVRKKMKKVVWRTKDGSALAQSATNTKASPLLQLTSCMSS